MTRSRRPVALASALMMAPVIALLLAACGPTASPPRDGATTAPAAATRATSSSAAATEGTATATLTTGSARVGSIPVPATQPRTPRTDRSGFLVALDPGHGGDESGAAAYGVVERDSNLDMAQRVRAYLVAAGVQVHLTREDNGRATGLVTPNGDTRNSTRNDLQQRVSAANRIGADIFVSLHSNGSGDPNMRGFEVYYESRRPFADENYRLAKELLDGALRGAANAGYPSPNRGIIDAACWRNFNGRCVGLFVLSPGGAPTSGGGQSGAQSGPPVAAKEATNMPAALLESLFISSPDDAAMLKSDTVRDAIAKGIADGILRYLGVPA